MEEYDKMVKSQRRWMIILLALFTVGIGIAPFRKFSYGLLLGGTVSFVNLWILHERVKDLGEAAATKGAVKSIGTLVRIILIVASVLIGLQFEHVFNIYAVIIGIASLYFVIVFESFVRSFIHVNRT